MNNDQIIVPVLYLAFDMFFGEDEEETELLEKIANFAEHTVPQFNDRQFQQNFRMEPDPFEDLLRKIAHVHQLRPHFGEPSPGHPSLPMEKETLITLWCLANMECFRSVACRFGISKSTCWDVLARTCQQILRVNSIFKIIWWPSPERALDIMAAFERINGFPGVVGVIDGSHVMIIPPKEFPNSYFNRKKFHSMLLQGVCDNNKLFIDVYAGQPVSMHDSRLFEKSDLSRKINNGELEVPNEGHLIGDLAYKLSTKLLVGFKNWGGLTQQQKNFNIKLSQIRVNIENAYALLKGRFRRLKFMETVRLDFISLFIVSACILHNICILNGDPPDNIINIQQEIDEERNMNAGNGIIYQNNNQNNNQAVIKRNNIMNALGPVRDHHAANYLRLARNQ